MSNFTRKTYGVVKSNNLSIFELKRIIVLKKWRISYSTVAFCGFGVIVGKELNKFNSGVLQIGRLSIFLQKNVKDV